LEADDGSSPRPPTSIADGDPVRIANDPAKQGAPVVGSAKPEERG